MGIAAGIVAASGRLASSPGVIRVDSTCSISSRAVGGTEIYARRLIAALGRRHPEAEFVAFCGREAAAELPDPDWPENVRVWRLPVPCAIKPLRLAAELVQLPAAAAKARVDVLHSLGTTTPVVTTCPRVVTLHDLIYDLYPDASRQPRAGAQAGRALGARRAHRVVTSSQATQEELVERFGLGPDRIDVVTSVTACARSPSPRRRRCCAAARARGPPVLLTVAAALPHKNSTACWGPSPGSATARRRRS